MNNYRPTKNLLFELWPHLSRYRRRQLLLLLLLMLASGLAEILSLGAIIPFLTVLSVPEKLLNIPFFREFFAKLSLENTNQLLLLTTFIFIVAAVLAALIRLSNLWFSSRLAAEIGSDFSSRCYELTLFQPYIEHLNKNSSDFITAATSHISRTVAAIAATLHLLSSVIVALGLIIGLIAIDWVVAIFTAVLFGLVYYFLALNNRKLLNRNSQAIANASKRQVQAIQEGLGSIRDVILDGKQQMYVDIYRSADRPQRILNANNRFLSMYPKYVVEALGLVAIAVLASFIMLQQGLGSTSVIPTLGGLALGAQRLLPTLQQVYRSWSQVKGFNADIAAVLRLLNQSANMSITRVGKSLSFDNVSFDNVYFKYGANHTEVLKGLSFQIKRGERIGIIGSTGSGKSTTIDILMGLLKPTKGHVLLDGISIFDAGSNDKLNFWRASISHVPQTVYLTDSTIAENIAFGVPSHDIDIHRVKHAAKQAQISTFIESCPDGYNTCVGERGTFLSGGQRQRIGIARALYKNAQVIIFDEATSALDTSTEKSLIDAINQLSTDLTLIMIAHRLSTIQQCDRILCIEKGTIAPANH